MKRIVIVLLLLVLLGITAVTLAGPTAFSISWWTVDGGGGQASGGDYAVTGTAGQFDAHPAATGGDYAIGGGFWQAGVVAERVVYLPVVVGN